MALGGKKELKKFSTMDSRKKVLLLLYPRGLQEIIYLQTYLRSVVIHKRDKKKAVSTHLVHGEGQPSYIMLCCYDKC